MRNSSNTAAASTVAVELVALPSTDVAANKPKRVRAAKPTVPAIDVAAVTEATPDARLARAERIAADRTAVSALYAAFETNRVSVPVKALSAFKPQSTTAHPIARQPSARQAAAIALAFSANGLKLIDGKSAPRVFDINGVRSCIENGVLRDAVSSGLVIVSGDTPETETIKLANKATVSISGLIGSAAIKAGKLA